MTLIEKLVKLRLDNFIREFNLDISWSNFNYLNNTRKIFWDRTKQKFIEHNLVNNHCDPYECYLVIENNIWKGIMANYIIDDKWHVHMYHNNFRDITELCYDYYPYISYHILLQKKLYKNPMLIDNCTKLQSKIIDYIMLIDILVTENMISDLAYMFKMCIYDVMLEL